MPDPALSLSEGAIAPWSGNRTEYFYRVVAAVAEAYGFSMKTPWAKLKKSEQRVLLQGSGTRQIHVQYRNRYGRVRSYHTHYEGVLPYLQRRHREAESDHGREMIEGYMRKWPVPSATAPGSSRSRWRSRWGATTSTSSAAFRSPGRPRPSAPSSCPTASG